MLRLVECCMVLFTFHSVCQATEDTADKCSRIVHQGKADCETEKNSSNRTELRNRYESSEWTVNYWGDYALYHKAKKTEKALMVEEEWKKYGPCPLDRLRSRFEERWNANWQFVCSLETLGIKAYTFGSGNTSYTDIDMQHFYIDERNEPQRHYRLLVLRTSPIASGQRKTDGSLCVKCKNWNEKADQPKMKSGITVTTKFWLDEHRQSIEKDLDLAAVVRRVRQKHHGFPFRALKYHFEQRWNTIVHVFCGPAVATSINAVTNMADSDRLDMVLFEIKEPTRPVYEVLIVRTAPMNYGVQDIFRTEDY